MAFMPEALMSFLRPVRPDVLYQWCNTDFSLGGIQVLATVKVIDR